MPMEINREHEGWAKLRSGTPGEHLAIDLMRAASGDIVGNPDSKGYQGAMKRIRGERHDPTVGYLRGSLMEYREKDGAFRNNLIAWDLGNLVYVCHFGQIDSEETLMRQNSRRMCRYHMRYTRGWEAFGDRRAKLETLLIDKVVIQKEILEGRFRNIEIPNQDREIQHGLDLVRNRWGCGRNKSGIPPIRRPLITSTELIQIHDREKIGWPEWRSVDRGNNGLF